MKRMTPLEMIHEWRRGCALSQEGKPESCAQCTRIMIDELEKAVEPYHAIDIWLPVLLRDYRHKAELYGFGLDISELQISRSSAAHQRSPLDAVLAQETK